MTLAELITLADDPSVNARALLAGRMSMLLQDKARLDELESHRMWVEDECCKAGYDVPVGGMRKTADEMIAQRERTPSQPLNKSEHG